MINFSNNNIKKEENKDDLGENEINSKINSKKDVVIKNYNIDQECLDNINDLLK